MFHGYKFSIILFFLIVSKTVFGVVNPYKYAHNNQESYGQILFPAGTSEQMEKRIFAWKYIEDSKIPTDSFAKLPLKSKSVTTTTEFTSLENEFLEWARTYDTSMMKAAVGIEPTSLETGDDTEDQCLTCGSHLKCKPGERSSNGVCVPTVSTQFGDY